MTTQQVPDILVDMADLARRHENGHYASSIYASKLLANGPYIQRFIEKFKCARCGNCENIGAVVVNWDDIRKLALTFNMSGNEFVKKYVRTENGIKLLLQPCPLYSKDTKSCMSYESRPQVCKLYPLHTVMCQDGLYHLGVRAECKSAIDILKELENEIWSEDPVIV